VWIAAEWPRADGRNTFGIWRATSPSKKLCSSDISRRPLEGRRTTYRRNHKKVCLVCIIGWLTNMSHWLIKHNLRQWGYVIHGVCLSVRLFVWLLATSRKNHSSVLYGNFTRDAFMDNKELVVCFGGHLHLDPDVGI